MDGSIVNNRARWTLAVIFTSFLVINVVVLTMALFAHLRGDLTHLPPHLGEEVSMGIRLVMTVIGVAAAWFFAGFLYRHLVKLYVSPNDSVSCAYSLLSYLVLVIVAFAFLGLGSWIWLPVLFLLILVWSLLSLWSLVGWIPMIIALILAGISGVLTWVMLA